MRDRFMLDVEVLRDRIAANAVFLDNLDMAIIGVDDSDSTPVYCYEGIIEGLLAHHPGWLISTAQDYYIHNIQSLLSTGGFRVVIQEIL